MHAWRRSGDDEDGWRRLTLLILRGAIKLRSYMWSEDGEEGAGKSDHGRIYHKFVILIYD